MHTTHTEVLVVGAGPTGLVLAIDLARRGIPHRVVERAERGFPGSRGTGIQPRTLEVFDDLGVLPAFLAESRAIAPSQIWEGAERVAVRALVESADDSPGIPYPDPQMLPQWRTVELLGARLEELGGHVDFRTELTGFTQDADGVTATVRHADGTAETVRAGWLVAADGGRSTVRKALGVPFTGERLPSAPMLIADVILAGPDRAEIDRDHWHMWPKSADGFLALRPLEGTEAVQVIAGLGDDAGDLEGEPGATPEQVTRLVAGRSGLRLTVDQVRWSSVYRAGTAMAERFREGRVILAGDAAHIHPPSGGQGLNTSLQDAYNLGWKLGAVLRLGAPEELLDSYDAERRRVAADVLGLASRVHRADQSGAEGGFQRRGKETHQLTLGYRESPLSRELRRDVPEGALRAGDRAPDAPCVDASGTAVRLFDLFRGPHFTLLDLTGAPAAAPLPDWIRTYAVGDGPKAALRDPEGHAKAAYGSGLFLVRPDGYVALATDDAADVAEYVRRVAG
ncbi:FAD-dependent monooxygenase [Streptomyces cinnamoneus]|uniref:FAD-dependent monooxygenase n=1 Tax=Streptomyces cinnamoneus TaxID=53446 RepID=UPI003436135C